MPASVCPEAKANCYRVEDKVAGIVYTTAVIAEASPVGIPIKE